MNVLVTGGTGFIGFNLINRLLDLGHNVFYTGSNNEQSVKTATLVTERDIYYNHYDIVFHCAAITDTLIEENVLEVNTFKPFTLFKRAYENGTKTIVYASSCAVYGDVEPPFKEDGETHPLNMYGCSKWLLDQKAMKWAKDKDINLIALRYSNVFGPFESHKNKSASMISQIGNQMILGNPRLFKYGEQKRDFIYVKDVVEINLKAAQFKGQEIFNVGSGVSTSFNEVVELFNWHFNIQRKTVFFDNPHEGKYQNYTCCNIDKLKNVLGYTPQWNVKMAIKDYFVPPFVK